MPESPVRYTALCRATVDDIVCCPGGLELRSKRFLGDLSPVRRWHLDLIGQGMCGLIASVRGSPRGFVEYIAAERAPFPIEAPGAAVLLCFHWAGTAAEDPDHLHQERRMIEHALGEAKASFTGMAALGWNHPVHFPIPLLKSLGFREVETNGPVSLMWFPFRRQFQGPRLAEATFHPRNLSEQGELAIDAAFSNRCPYSVHHATKLERSVAAHPRRDRIQLRLYRIDTRADAFALATPPWDWGWVYLNAVPLSLFGLSDQALADRISSSVPHRAQSDT